MASGCVMASRFDVIIVGGGSAGSVLASRLSEDGHRQVLLIEAGRDIAEGAVPRHVSSPYAGLAYFDPSLTYTNLSVRMGGTRSNAPDKRPAVPYAQGRALGGGSVVNGMGANRGAPSDYDEWEDMGASGWNWASVLPYFRKLERHLDVSAAQDPDRCHGHEGPLPIRAVPTDWRSGFVNAAVSALARRGHAEKADQNGAWQDGVFAQAVNLDETFQRIPASIAWLTPRVRARSNLTILTGMGVHRLICDGDQVSGVVLDGGDRRMELRASEVIVSAGALQTPALLMRSGIGPAAQLQERGVTVQHHLGGVGRNLMEHPYAGISMYLPRASRMASDRHHHIPALWRFSSGLEGCPQGDMHLGLMGRAAWHGIGRRMGALAFWVNKSFSRGHVALADNVDDPPDIDMRLLSDERDRVRLRQAFVMVAGIASDVARTGACGPPQPAQLSDRARKYGPVTGYNRLATGLAGLVVDASGPFAARTMQLLTQQGPRLADLVHDESALDDYLDRSVTGVWHASGTCRMGRSDDPLAVTNAAGRVHGMAGLRICDASLFPAIPCANLNIPVLMTAERISELIKAGS